jgi:hypothetical protein
MRKPFASNAAFFSLKEGILKPKRAKKAKRAKRRKL